MLSTLRGVAVREPVYSSPARWILPADQEDAATMGATVVTPMALLMTALSVGLTPEAAVARVADTLLGVVIGIVVAAVAISGADRRSFSLPPHKGNELHTR